MTMTESQRNFLERMESQSYNSHLTPEKLEQGKRNRQKISERLLAKAEQEGLDVPRRFLDIT
ncbi:TPA: hypothetical protein VB845_002058 [Streptococcus suis]|nr:hypothetical protein [Streptococcus suis]